MPKDWTRIAEGVETLKRKKEGEVGQCNIAIQHVAQGVQTTKTHLTQSVEGFCGNVTQGRLIKNLGMFSAASQRAIQAGEQRKQQLEFTRKQRIGELGQRDGLVKQCTKKADAQKSLLTQVLELREEQSLTDSMNAIKGPNHRF